MDEIRDPVQAVTAPDPYPYYAALRERHGLYHEPRLDAWVATAAAVVDAALQHPGLRVRPPGQPVPPALQGTPAGAVYARLVRMSEGPAHAGTRRAVTQTLDPMASGQVAGRARDHAAQALAMTAPGDRERLRALYRVPLLTMAEGIGVPIGQRERVALLTERFVACLSPLSGAPALSEAQDAVHALHGLFDEGLSSWAPAPPSGGPERETWIANLIGLLSQTCDATAGLIGNTLVALGREPALVSRLRQGIVQVAEVVDEVARHDPPIQNTRRYAAEPLTLAGHALEAGQCVLLLLASANRDPAPCGTVAIDPAPDVFAPGRPPCRSFGYGAGHHRCPGDRLASAIAGGVVQALLAAQASLLDGLAQRLLASGAYRASVNARIPCFP
ncbi:cytochrome P450 [Caldimonas brevitalea]|uniref:Cytochrome p450 oxidoreductase n=1 Tax=Caldimonas brevitalea TaxID=413882 RepID=A0A0G3BFR4_9BURK|nr:cytochrome P450 [Caldimonas brevitalea]AKJ28182.1 cytochrome p450 oxidoreductase [Caldimonas brevitalea]